MAVERWRQKGEDQVFRLFGYAGTGKTTLARHFAEHVDGQVQFAAFTGKAAQVLRARGATKSERERPEGQRARHARARAPFVIPRSTILAPRCLAAWRCRRE